MLFCLSTIWGTVQTDNDLVFRFEIDLVHYPTTQPFADITFFYSSTTGLLICQTNGIQTPIQRFSFVNCWELQGMEREISSYVNDVELTNFLATGPEPNIKTIFTSAVMGFPDPENFQTGEEYNPGTIVPLWRGTFYGLTVSHTTYTKNNIVYNFRNWINTDNYSSSTTFRIEDETDEFRSMFQPTHALTVSNYLEGGNSSNNYQLTWHNPEPDIVIPWQFGMIFNAFRYPINEDVYSVTAPSTFQALSTSWNFYKWNDGSTNNVKSNLQITAPTSFTAYYKGIQRSDDENAYASSSQRKFVRTDDDWLHNVYCSQGRVWYETSSNNGVTWQLANNGQPLDNGLGKMPSIDYALKSTGGLMIYQIAIVFQEKSGGSSSKIKIKYFEKIDDNPNLNFISQKEIANVTGDYTTTSTNPVIGFSHGSVATVIWKNGNTGSLYGWYGSFGSVINTLMGPAQISGTTVNSINPTIYAKKTGTTLSFKLAWEELGAVNTSSIKYATLIGYLMISGAITTPSIGSGFSQNYSPSIIQFMDASRLCWVGYRWISDPINEEDGFPQIKVLFKAPESTPSRFWQFGNFVSGPSINR